MLIACWVLASLPERSCRAARAAGPSAAFFNATNESPICFPLPNRSEARFNPARIRFRLRNLLLKLGTCCEKELKDVCMLCTWGAQQFCTNGLGGTSDVS